MIDTARPAPFFLADSRALDFLNSVAFPWGNEIEWLSDGHDLLTWLEHAGLVPASVLTKFREEAVLEELDAVAAQARKLREWFRTFVGAHAGLPLIVPGLDISTHSVARTPFVQHGSTSGCADISSQNNNASALAELEPINGLLARNNGYRQIEARSLSEQDGDPHSSALRWREERRWHSPDSLLLPLAEAMGDLICRDDFAHVKNCESPTCTLWFYDVSKNHTRRWCSMAVCGNRAKAAAHRAKKRSYGHQDARSARREEGE